MPNILTKAVASFFGWGTPYESAAPSPRRSTPPGAAVEAHKELTQYTRGTLLKNSRYLNKNSGFHREISSCMQLYAVGEGSLAQSDCDPDAMIDGRPAREVMEEVFNAWAVNCEMSGRFSLEEVEGMVSRYLDVDGEVFIVRARDRFRRAKLQIIETHRVGDGGKGDTIDGIKFDQYGAFAGIRVIQDDGNGKDVPAFAVLHVFEPEIASLVRNAPTGQHGVNHLLDEIELLALEKHAVKANADTAHVLSVSDDTADELDTAEEITRGATATAAAEGTSTDVQLVQKALGGKALTLRTGETLTSFESKRPNPTFTGFLKHLRRDSANGVLPAEFVDDVSQIGGAGVRLVVGKADRRFAHRQSVIRKRFLNAVWAFVIGDAIDRGEIPAVEGWQKVYFQAPRRVTVDAGHDAAARNVDLASGRITLSEDCAERGVRFSAHLADRVSDAKAILDAAKAADVPAWMLFCPPSLTNLVAAELKPAPVKKEAPKA